MPRGPKGEKRPADVIGAAIMALASAAERLGRLNVKQKSRWPKCSIVP